MKNHFNIGDMSDDRKNSPYTFLAGFQQQISNPYYKNAEAEQQEKPGPLIYEWQLVDNSTEKSGKEDDGSLYVADWHMIDQKSDWTF
jgi:hypothetical protein